MNYIFDISWPDTAEKPTAVLFSKADIGGTGSGSGRIFRKIKWRQTDSEVIISGDIENCTTSLPPTKYKYTSVLKSNLQKCVRRRLTEKALSTAKVMMKTDFIHFIRRLLIIMIEDAVLHESIAGIMWMTAAYPTWQPTRKHMDWLLSIVSHISELRWRDDYICINYDFRNDLAAIENLPEPGRTILYSLCFRMSYGGMKGDMNMLVYHIRLWMRRFAATAAIAAATAMAAATEDIPLIKMSQIKNIKITELEPSAIDFHCWPGMLKQLAIKFPQFTSAEIKSAIWYYSSSINSKQPIRDHSVDPGCRDSNFTDIGGVYAEIWATTCAEVGRLAARYIINI